MKLWDELKIPVIGIVGWALFCLWFVAITNPACAEFEPLTRDEPIVRMVLQEAANEPFDGMVTVAGVALDRAADKRWPASVRDVVYEPYQFSGMELRLRRYSAGQITRARLAVSEAELGTRPCGQVLWYHAAWMMPAWDFNKIEEVCRIGVHVFYGDAT